LSRVFSKRSPSARTSKGHEFLKQHQLDVSILLDWDGEVGTAYGARALPTLVLIDKKGVIQSVHVGFSPSLKTALRKQLEQVLAGKNLAAEASSPRRLKEPSADAASAPQRLESQWSLPGGYSDAAYEPGSKTIFALKRDGCDAVSLDGKVQRPLMFDAHGSKLRFARLSGPGDRAPVVFGNWGRSIAAVRASDGSVMWEEKNATGVDDVWAADLDGDGRDEVIIGYNGFAGLHVLSPDGAPRWQSAGIGNVWHVAAGDLNGDKKCRSFRLRPRERCMCLRPTAKPSQRKTHRSTPCWFASAVSRRRMRPTRSSSRAPSLAGACRWLLSTAKDT
jgi:Redoxin